MAKFAQVGYGSRGQGVGKTADGYTYVVNDNVRTGDKIQVISTSSRGNKFATTAVPLHTYKENSVKGQELKQRTISFMENVGKKGEITQSYSGKELGLSTKGIKQNIYQQQTRAGNIAMYMQQHPDATFSKVSQETFDTYSKQFMNKGEQ